jgi:hypothetical protein
VVVSDKDHFDALRAADQRAVELLAQANAARINHAIMVISIIVALASILVAVAALMLHR